jgi:hypothetical protein
LLRDALLLRRLAHTVNKHTGEYGSSRVNDAHLRSLSNTLLVTSILLSDVFRCLNAERFSQLISP